MPILCYEIIGEALPNHLSTTGAKDGQIAAVLKCDHEEANAQVYSELAANRLAMFLGIPVVVGVPARSAPPDLGMRFAALRAAEAGLDIYDFTTDDPLEGKDEPEDAPPLPSGVYLQGAHLRATAAMCKRYPLETAFIAVFDLWIANQDRVYNFKAQLSAADRGVIFALDQGSSLLACRAQVADSLEALGNGAFPSHHPFQKLVNSRYCGVMVERICAMPDWAIQAATTYDDTVGNVTLDEQFAAYVALLERRKFLGDLVDRVLL